MQTRILSYTELKKRYAPYDRLLRRLLSKQPQLAALVQKQTNPHYSLKLEASGQMRIINESTPLFTEEVIAEVQELEASIIKIEQTQETFATIRF